MMEGNPRSNYTGTESTVDYSPVDIRRPPLIHPVPGEVDFYWEVLPKRWSPEKLPSGLASLSFLVLDSVWMTRDQAHCAMD